VSLQLPNSAGVYQHQCGGTIIAEDIVLTAGHCSVWFDKILIDRYDLEDPNETSFSSYTPQSITVHPLFDSILFRYDYTVVHINESISSTIAPIRLNQNTTLPANGAALTIVGWGATERNGYTGDLVFPTAFQKGQVFAIDNAACAATVVNGQTLYQGEIFEDMLCADASVRHLDSTSTGDICVHLLNNFLTVVTSFCSGSRCLCGRFRWSYDTRGRSRGRCASRCH
jgi:Trypsin